MTAMRKKLNIFTLQLSIYYILEYLLNIRIGNLHWCKWGHFKNEAGDINCLCCREVDAMLLAPAKIHPVFMAIYPTISHTY